MDALADRLNCQIDSWLAARRGCVAAVLDTASSEVLNQVFRGGGLSEEPLVHVPLPQLQLDPELLPALLPLSVGNWLLRQRTVELALKVAAGDGCPVVCGWLWSDTDARTLAARLGQSMVRLLPRGRRFLFRQHDPRVRACLSELLGSEWLAQQMHPGHEWLSAAHGQMLMTRHERHPPSTSSAHVPAERALRAMQRTEEINRAIRFALECGWRFSNQGYTIANAALDRCESRAFAGAADRLAYMLHALTVSAHFDRHPAIELELRTAAATHTTYVQVAGRIPRDIWDAARAMPPAIP